MDENYCIVKFDSSDINYLNHIRYEIEKTELVSFYRGNREWVIIGDDEDTINETIQRFSNGNCKVTVSSINKK